MFGKNKNIKKSICIFSLFWQHDFINMTKYINISVNHQSGFCKGFTVLQLCQAVGNLSHIFVYWIIRVLALNWQFDVIYQTFSFNMTRKFCVVSPYIFRSGDELNIWLHIVDCHSVIIVNLERGCWQFVVFFFTSCL